MSDPPKPPLPPTTILPAVPAGSVPAAPSPLPPTTIRPRSFLGPVALHCTRESFEAVVRWVAERADPAVLSGDVPRR